MVELAGDPSAQVLDAVWDEEWQKNLIDSALEKLKPQVSVKQYQVFYLNVVKAQPAREVAKSMNVTGAYVHLTRHRVQPLFKKAVEQVERNNRQ
jgi:DNA-directed RNA polymerase specialized sigma24 family protein